MTMTLIGRDPTTLELSNPPTINSWDDFSQLREVIVGRADGTCLPNPSDISAWLACYPKATSSDINKLKSGELPRRVVEECAEDLTILSQTLENIGVIVHQPKSASHSRPLATPFWDTSATASCRPRGAAIILGSTIIEAASPTRSRYFEVFDLRDLFLEYMRKGASWIAAPKPQLGLDLYGLESNGLPILLDTEPVFDATNILRVGRDLFYRLNRNANELGMKWLTATARLIEPTLRIHPVHSIKGDSLNDGAAFAILRRGLLLADPKRIGPDQLPPQFRSWDAIWTPEAEAEQVSSGESTIKMNLLMVRPDLAIAEASRPALLRLLESKGIQVLPIKLRHGRLFGAGIRCMTLDTVRDGGLEDYFEN